MTCEKSPQLPACWKKRVCCCVKKKKMERRRSNSSVDEGATATATTLGIPLLSPQTECVQAAAAELLAEDGLLVAAPGLGVAAAFVATVVRLHCEHSAAAAVASSSSSASASTSTSASSPLSAAQAVMVVNAPRGLFGRLSSALRSSSSTLSSLAAKKLIRVSAAVGAAQRAGLYRSGGVFFVSARTLAVDLLSGRAPAHVVGGVVVLRAERIAVAAASDGGGGGGEGFALRVLRDTNRGCFFVKAVSEDPSALARALHSSSSSSSSSCVSFAEGVSRLLARLHVRRLFLWPRFRSDVQRALDAHPPDVVELSAPLTPLMRKAQDAILGAMRGCIAEISAAHSLSFAASLSSSDEAGGGGDVGELMYAARAVRAELEPIWGRVGAQTRQLVADLGGLRRLLGALMRADCVGFLQLLETLEETRFCCGADGGARSVWMFSRDGDALFHAARSRVYVRRSKKQTRQQGRDTRLSPSSKVVVVVGGGGGTSPQPRTPLQSKKDKGPGSASAATSAEDSAAAAAGGGGGEEEEAEEEEDDVVAVLEENPKWALLHAVLQEIRREQASGATGAPGAVLVVTKEARTAAQLQRYLAMGGRGALRARYAQYLARKAARAVWQQERRERASSSAASGRRRSRGGSGNKKRARGGRYEAAKSAGSRRGRRRSEGATDEGEISTTAKKKKNEEEEGDGEASKEEEKPNGGKKKEEEEEENAMDKIEEEEEEEEEGFTVEELDGAFGVVDRGAVIVRSLETEGTEGGRWQLEDAEPKFVVVFDASVRMVRQIEAYRAERPGAALRVYFLSYADSAEQRKYRASVQREKDAFEKLIRAKQTMVLRSDDVEEEDDGALAPMLPDSMRHGGDGDGVVCAMPRGSRTVLVDLREFRSTLPGMLHRRGLRVRPTHLVVGDYILAPDVGVERKALGDLFSSFASGRLFGQAEALCKQFALPVLLIEWGAAQSFHMPATAAGIGASESGGVGGVGSVAAATVTERDIRGKLVILAMHFPRLRVLWSRSPACTAAMFEALKEGRPEPTDSGCDGDGDGDDDAAVGVVEDEEESAETALEMLTRMPGVGDKAAKRIASTVAAAAGEGQGEGRDDGISLARLSRMPREALASTLQVDAATAGRLASFFAFEPPAL